MCFQSGRTPATASKHSSRKQGATAGVPRVSQHSSTRRSLWKRFRRDGGVLPANRATLACLASYGQRAIPLISSPAASRLSICRNEGKGQRSEVKPTLTFSVWDSVIFKALPLWGRSFRWLFLSWRFWRRSIRSRALTWDVSGTQLTFLPKYIETNRDQECHGILAPQHDSEEERTRNLSD